MTTTNSLHLKKTLSLLGLAILGVVVFVLSSQYLMAAPKIEWDRKRLETVVAVGDLETISISFTASKALDGLTVRVVPSLAGFVSVEPTEISAVQKGETFQLEATILPDSSDLIGDHDGTIQIRQGKKNVAKPLPVSIHISSLIGNPITTLNGEMTIVVPIGLVPVEFLDDPGNQQIYLSDPETLSAEAHGTFALGIQVINMQEDHDLGVGATLYDLIALLTVHLSNVSTVEELIGDHRYVIFYDDFSEQTFYATPLDEARVLLISTSNSDKYKLSDEDVRRILSTLALDPIEL